MDKVKEAFEGSLKRRLLKVSAIACGYSQIMCSQTGSLVVIHLCQHSLENTGHFICVNCQTHDLSNQGFMWSSSVADHWPGGS